MGVYAPAKSRFRHDGFQCRKFATGDSTGVGMMRKAEDVERKPGVENA